MVMISDSLIPNHFTNITYSSEKEATTGREAMLNE